jgi:hypothetical protein
VSLNDNPGLEAYLHLNRANPTSSSLAAETYQHSLGHPGSSEELDFLRQEIFDALREPSPTPEGNEGFMHRVSVTVHFKPETFDKLFRHLPGMPHAGNVSGRLYDVKEVIYFLPMNNQK